MDSPLQADILIPDLWQQEAVRHMVDGKDVADVTSAITALADIDDKASVRIKRHGRTRKVTVAAGEFEKVNHSQVKIIKVERHPNAPGKTNVSVEVISD